jgi:alcohol dehydrogenase class IV
MPQTVNAPLDAYEFAAPPLIRFGAGASRTTGAVAAAWGRRAWIVGGGRSLAASGAGERVLGSLAEAGIEQRHVASSRGEPTVDQVAAALAAVADAPREGVVVVAIGGGATIDLAKAIAALATNVPVSIAAAGVGDAGLDAAIVDHLEGVGRGLAISHWPLPVIAIPTTAGTGAEATRNAVIACPRRRFKKSLRSPLMVPKAAVVDPDLTASCDRGTIAASGLDCITQLIEAFVCRFAKPLPRCLVLEALPRALAALPRLLEESAAPPADRLGPGPAADRAALSHAALLSGLALTNSGLGLAHGVAAALGAAHGTPHGVACATMLPVALRVNRPVAAADFAALERAIDPTASRDDEVAADAFVDRVERLCQAAGVPIRLADLGVSAGGLDWLAEHSGGSSMRGNPVQLTPGQLRAVLAAHL